MSSGFGALRDNRVNPALLQLSRLRCGRRAGDDENAGGFDCRDDLRLRQAEMKADDLRFRLQQHCYVFAADIAGSTLRFRHRAETLGVVNRLQVPTHRLADFRRVNRLRP
jgi:hypothetical protein